MPEHVSMSITMPEIDAAWLKRLQPDSINQYQNKAQIWCRVFGWYTACDIADIRKGDCFKEYTAYDELLPGIRVAIEDACFTRIASAGKYICSVYTVESVIVSDATSANY